MSIIVGVPKVACFTSLTVYLWFCSRYSCGSSLLLMADRERERERERERAIERERERER